MEIIRQLLTEIDQQQDKMIQSGFNHESIHHYRESIRKLRAILFFFKDYIQAKAYIDSDLMSKYFFNLTSLIREIDVFENGYVDCMSNTTLHRLNELKTSVREEMIEAFQIPYSDYYSRFSDLNIVFAECDASINPLEDPTDMTLAAMIQKSHKDLLNEFIQLDESQFSEEKYIHRKRMLAKKWVYTYELFPSYFTKYQLLYEPLAHFQSEAKHLHDICVDLRFVGQFKLDDPMLLNQLVEDYTLFSVRAKEAYAKTCEAVSKLESLD